MVIKAKCNCCPAGYFDPGSTLTFFKMRRNVVVNVLIRRHVIF